MKKYLAFRDKTPMEEYDLHYTPTGIICNTSEILKEGCRSWKDYHVIYFDVCGVHCSQWRGIEEVDVFYVSEDTWMSIHYASELANEIPKMMDLCSVINKGEQL